jgi:hypothetical protein
MTVDKVLNPLTGNYEAIINEHKSLNDYVTHPMTSTQNNAATLLTQAGVAGKSWYISYVNWRVSGGATAAANQAVAILDGETTIYRSAVPGNSPNGANLSIEFPNPIKITAGNSVTYSIGASGTPGTLIHANMGLFLK